MNSIQGFNLNREKLEELLKRFERGSLTIDEARELKPLLEEERKKALIDDDLDLARDIVSNLIALNGIIAGRIFLAENVSISERL